MPVTDVLKDEHRVIERMLAVLERAAQRLEEGQEVPPDVFHRAIDFVRTFADRCHHGKEEDTLFPVLEARGLPREGGPVGVMLVEHDQGRGFVQAMAAALGRYEQGDKAAGATVALHARAYIELLREHIMKEDNILFPMAERVLSEADQRELSQRFEQVEKEAVGEGVHQKYEELLGNLERELGIG